jgi:hypothetical protein
MSLTVPPDPADTPRRCAHVFLSYASEDRPLAVWLHDRLIEAGAGSVWLDRKNIEGGDWRLPQGLGAGRWSEGGARSPVMMLSSRALCLLATKGHVGVHAGGAAGREQRGQAGHQHQQHRDSESSLGLCWRGGNGPPTPPGLARRETARSCPAAAVASRGIPSTSIAARVRR